jgi:hypothetical protein
MKLLYETLHVDDFKIVGHPLEAVSLIEVDEDAIQRRADALIAENVAASRKFEEHK